MLSIQPSFQYIANGNGKSAVLKSSVKSSDSGKEGINAEIRIRNGSTNHASKFPFNQADPNSANHQSCRYAYKR